MREADHLDVPGITRRVMLQGGPVACWQQDRWRRCWKHAVHRPAARRPPARAAAPPAPAPRSRWRGRSRCSRTRAGTGPRVQRLQEAAPGGHGPVCRSVRRGSPLVGDVENHKGEFDMVLGGPPTAVQLKDSGLLAPLDVAAVPNLSLVGSNFRTSFPWGIPDGLREDRIRLPQGPDLRASDLMEGVLGAL